MITPVSGTDTRLSTPGEILVEEYLRPLDIGVGELAERMRLDESEITRIIDGRQRIGEDTAIRLAVALDTTSEFWLTLQDDYDRMS